MAERPFALSIAGIDPSGGAGLLSDIKTFEKHKVYGLGIATANTIQTEDSFGEIEWVDQSFIIKSIDALLARYTIKAVKIGIIESLNSLIRISTLIKGYNEDIQIIWDPVISSSTDHDFHKDFKVDEKVYENIDVITPNLKEWTYFKNSSWSDFNITICLKGGHAETPGTDVIYTNGSTYEIGPQTKSPKYEKHGSGCIYSSAFTAQLALGKDINEAAINSKSYTEKILSSNPGKLGYHHGATPLYITR